MHCQWGWNVLCNMSYDINAHYMPYGTMYDGRPGPPGLARAISTHLGHTSLFKFIAYYILLSLSGNLEVYNRHGPTEPAAARRFIMMA